MKKVDLTMSELNKYKTIKALSEGNLTFKTACARLNFSKRHVRRLLKRYKEDGKNAFSHKRKGISPSNKISDKLKNEIYELFKEKYFDMNFKHFTEIINEQHKINISYSSIEKILKEKNIISPKARRKTKKEHEKKMKSKMAPLNNPNKELDPYLDNIHPTKERKAYFGELFQLDGSKHKWFNNEYSSLQLAIDDATGCVIAGHFTKNENLESYYNILYQIITKYGIPANVLTDRHSIFNYKRKDAPTDAEDTFTQFSYACHQLRIQLEVTSVPQSKGRIERLNGSFQSRLCPLFRINNIKTIEEANAFLPSFIEEYNQRFALQVDNNKNVFVK